MMRSSMTRSSLITMWSLLFVLAGGVTFLQAQEDESPNQGNLSLSAGTNFTTAYYFRGRFQEDQGLISQPWAEVGATLYEGKESSLSANMGLWWSLHSNHTGSSGSTAGRSSVYEEDLYGGLSYGYKDWSFGVSYVFFTSPNDAFATVEEIDYSISYDDSEALGDYALSPSVTIAQEIDNSSGADETVYAELGLSPGTTLNKEGKHPISLTLPTTFGFSVDDYYVSGGDEDRFGYLKIGPHASIPLASNTNYGSWTLSAGVDYYLLAADSLETLNAGDDSELEASVSISMSY